MNTPANETDKWIAEDYSNNSSAQRAWANELITPLDQTYRATMQALESLPHSELDQLFLMGITPPKIYGLGVEDLIARVTG